MKDRKLEMGFLTLSHPSPPQPSLVIGGGFDSEFGGKSSDIHAANAAPSSLLVLHPSFEQVVLECTSIWLVLFQNDHPGNNENSLRRFHMPSHLRTTKIPLLNGDHFEYMDKSMYSTPILLPSLG